jgi:arsenic resistance protein ArsH
MDMTSNSDGPAQLDVACFERPCEASLFPTSRATHAPRFLLLYGSLRERSYSKLLIHEAQRLLEHLGGEVRIYDPAGLPQPDAAPRAIPRCKNCAIWPHGARAWCGARQSAMAP